MQVRSRGWLVVAPVLGLAGCASPAEEPNDASEAQQFVGETVDKWMQPQSGGPAGTAGALMRYLGGRTDREPSAEE